MKFVDFGTDIDDSMSLDPETGDFRTVSDDDNANQGIRNRVLTGYDELAEIGHVRYGNNALYFLKITDVDLAIPHIEIYTKQALDRDPRVQEVLSIESFFEDNMITVFIKVLKVNEVISDLEPVQWMVFS